MNITQTSEPQLICDIDHHNQPIIALCLNNQCNQMSPSCIKCIVKIHSGHSSDCKPLDEINVADHGKSLFSHQFKVFKEDMIISLMEIETLVNVQLQKLPHIEPATQVWSIDTLNAIAYQLKLFNCDRHNQQIVTLLQECQSDVYQRLQLLKQSVQLDHISIQPAFRFVEQVHSNIQLLNNTRVFENGREGDNETIMIEPSITQGVHQILFRIHMCKKWIDIGITSDFQHFKQNEFYAKLTNSGKLYYTDSNSKHYTEQTQCSFEAGDMLKCILDKHQNTIQFTNLKTHVSTYLKSLPTSPWQLGIKLYNAEVEIYYQ